MQWKALAFLMLIGVGVGAATPALAHTELVSSSPVAGARLEVAPAQVTLVFADDVSLDGATIVATSTGRATKLTGLRFGASLHELVADVPDSLRDVQHVVFRWRVIAADGHASSGSIAVGVGVAAATPRAQAAAQWRHHGLIERLFVFDRLIGYAAMALLAGAWAFLVLVWPDGAGVLRARVLMWTCVVAGVISAMTALALEAATRNRRAGAALSLTDIGGVLDSPFGRAWVARALLFTLAVPVVVAVARGGAAMARSPMWITAAAACGIGLLRTPGFVSHASEATMPVLGSIADLVHLGGVAVWLGGLAMLLVVVLPRARADELAAVVPRFSTVAFASITCIVAAGAVMSWQLVGSFAAIADSGFGRVLALKLALFAAVIGAAFASKRWTQHHLHAAAPPAALRLRPFVISVTAEAITATAVLAVASILVATNPAR